MITRAIQSAARMHPLQARGVVRFLAHALVAAQERTDRASGGDVLASKVSVPSDLRTAQWSALPTWIRERAFFMASVDRAEVLDGFRDAATKYVAGDLGLAEARNLLREDLSRLGYAPLPGQAGTIKDLGSIRRMNLALETNLAQVNGFARWARQQDALGGFPAQRLIRVAARKVPRNWRARWDAAVRMTTVKGTTDDREMVALVNHPIWIALSRFGTPYPPFDFNSGMGIEPVDREEAGKLGLLDGSEAVRRMMQPQDRGLNETLAAEPQIRSQAIRSALAQALQGLAAWQGDQLLFTDPNGTKSYGAAELAQVWDAVPQPEDGEDDGGYFPLLQRDAVAAWAADPNVYRGRGHTDAWEDFSRAARRIDRSKPAPQPTDPARAGLAALARMDPERIGGLAEK